MKHIIRLVSMTFAAVGFLAIVTAQVHAEPGQVVCHSDGTAKEIADGLTHWTGVFNCGTTMDAGKGLLHRADLDCSGHLEFQGAVYTIGYGYCNATHPGGDIVHLRWEMVTPGTGADGFTSKWTYMSGTGKYEGINGGVKLSWKQVGSTIFADMESSSNKH